jgi:hypothetical protein
MFGVYSRDLLSPSSRHMQIQNFLNIRYHTLTSLFNNEMLLYFIVELKTKRGGGGQVEIKGDEEGSIGADSGRGEGGGGYLGGGGGDWDPRFPIITHLPGKGKESL